MDCNRLNCRKIDLIPAPEWRDPPKEVIDRLLEAVQQRRKGAGIVGGLHEIFDLTMSIARARGLRSAPITSNVKHVEVGLTDKSYSIDWMMRELAAKVWVSLEDVLIVGRDEFGPIAGFEGSDHRMMTPSAEGAAFASVGKEPGGTPPGVIHLGGGPVRFLCFLDEQIELHEQGAPLLQFVPTPDPSWLLVEERFAPAREREVDSLFALANGYLGTRASIEEDGRSSSPVTFVAGLFGVAEGSTSFPELAVAPHWGQV